MIGTKPQIDLCGILFAARKLVSQRLSLCDHCTQPIVGNTYRVTSEEDGVVVMEMIVCQPCCREAKKLGLKTEDFDPEGRAISRA